MSLPVESAWAAFHQAATQSAALMAQFNGCRVVALDATRVVVERVATGSQVVITQGLVEKCIRKVNEGGGVAKRRSLDYTVAKESTVVNLHPWLQWSEDEKNIEAVPENVPPPVERKKKVKAKS